MLKNIKSKEKKSKSAKYFKNMLKVHLTHKVRQFLLHWLSHVLWLLE